MFRIFDALNDVEQMRPAIEAVRATGTTVAEVALCYTGDLSDPDEKLYTLDYYLRPRRADRRRRRARAGDQGHGRAAARAGGAHPGHRAARAVRPAGAPAHPRHPGRPARDAARRDRRRASTPSTPHRLDGRHHVAAARSRRWSRPPTTRRARPGSSWTRSATLEPYWEATRRVYAPFESGLPSPTGRVYTHEIPGGQLSNLRQQAIALGLGEKFEQIEDMYAAANDILGNIVKVTPSSKVVGDLALHLVAVGADPAEFAEDPAKFDIPDSVIGFLNGELGDPPGGWPEPFRTKALEGRTWKPRAAELDRGAARGPAAGDRRGDAQPSCCSRARPRSSRSRGEKYGDVSVLPTMRLPLRPAPRRGARGRARRRARR